MKKLLLCVLLVVGVGLSALAVPNPVAGEYPTDESSPYYQRVLPNYFSIVSQRITMLAPNRKAEITAADLPFLEILFSEGAMYRIERELPIKNWQQLANLTYVSAASTSGDPRAVCSEMDALILRLVFVLANGNDANVWPWSQ